MMRKNAQGKKADLLDYGENPRFGVVIPVRAYAKVDLVRLGTWKGGQRRQTCRGEREERLPRFLQRRRRGAQ